jgi:diadenosine tetraphosphate (Ap4A) HIT family hydrolase
VDPTCGICASLERRPLFENEIWHVRHLESAGVPGWMVMTAKRHVAGPAHFDDREAAAFGPALRHFERVLERVTGALRIYTAALGERYPHFHAHMVPRYATMPRDAAGWSVFDLERAVTSGEITIDTAEVARISAAYEQALRDDPP